MAVTTPFNKIGEPQPEPAPPEAPQTWSSIAAGYPEQTVSYPQLGTYEVQPAPIEPDMIGPFYRTPESARAAAAAGPQEPTTIDSERVARWMQPGAAGTAAYLGDITSAIFNPLTAVYEKPEQAPEWGMALSPLNLLLPGAIAQQGVARVGGGIVGGTVGQQLASEYLPEDMNPLLRFGLELGAGAAGGLAGERLGAVSPYAYNAVRGAIRPSELSVAAEKAAGAGRFSDELIPTISRPLRQIEEIQKSPAYVDLRPSGFNIETPQEPGAIFRVNAKQARSLGIGDEAGVYVAKGNGKFAKFADTPATAAENAYRLDPQNIARGRQALLSRFDMEARMGRIPQATADWGRAFVEALPDQYVVNLASSFPQRIFPSELGGSVQSGETVSGLYDHSNMLMRIAKSALENTNDPTRTIIHEISHHLEQFVSATDARQLVRQYERELAGKGKIDLNRYQDAMGNIGEIIFNASAGAPGLEGKIARTLQTQGYEAARNFVGENARYLGNSGFEGTLRNAMFEVSKAQRGAYRYQNFQEWFAENMADRFAAEATYTPPTSVYGRVMKAIKDFSGAFIDATRKVFGREDVASRVYNDIMESKYNVSQRRDLTGLLGREEIPSGAGEEAAGAAKATEGAAKAAREVPLSAASEVTPSPIRIAKSVIPGPVRATPGAAEEGERVGNLLRPRGLEQLGPEPQVKDVLGVANDLARQVGSQNVSLGAEIESANRTLGPTVLDAQGNVRLKNVIKPDGAPAIKQDVFENPGRYNLTPEQADAVSRLQSVAETVRNEAKMFNVDVKETLLQEGQNYIPRKVVSVAGDEALQKSGTVSARRLTKLREEARQYTDPLEAIAKGVVYDDPAESLKSYVNSNLQGAANQHIIDALKEFGVSDPSEFLSKARVSEQAAPTLSGLYFEPTDAKKITRYYSTGMLPETTVGDVLKTIKTVNNKIVPWQAIGDAAATLKQLGTVLTSKPTTFAKNFGQSFVDAWGGWNKYQNWLASSEVKDAASHGVNIIGGKSPGMTDFWSGLAERIPGLKQTQRQFESIGNRNRVSLYQQDLDMLRRTGQPVDELAMEQVARNANRMTGTSNNKATDIESLGLFAPNFLRARFETIGKALTDRTLEGDLARQYMSNYAFAGLSAVAAAALYQGRDLKDVLNPVTVSPNGRFKWNPNFGTIRVGDTDIDVFSGYSGLVRILVTAADAPYGAIKERDLGQLVSGLYNSGMALESPSASIVDALVRASYGSTAYGEDPRTLEFWVKKPMPIGAAQTIQAIQAGQSPEQIGFSQGAQFFGARASAMTPTEMAQAGKYEKLGAIPQFKALNAQSWKVIGEQAPESLKEEIKKYNSFYDWEQGTRILYTQLATEQAQQQGVDPALIPGAVDKAIQQLPIYKAHAQAKDYFETKWVTEHPKEAYDIWVEERQKQRPSWLPTKPQQAIILQGGMR